MNEIVEIVLFGILAVICCICLYNRLIGLVFKEFFDSIV